MNQDFSKIYKYRPMFILLEWVIYLCISLLFHILVLAILLLVLESKTDISTSNIAWVTTPSTSCPSGGSASLIKDSQESRDDIGSNERQRRISKIVAHRTGHVDSKSLQSLSKSVHSMRKSADVGKVSTTDNGTNRTTAAQETKVVAPNPTIGTAGIGAGGGIGAGSSVRGLRAHSGANGATGLISELDGNFPFVWYLQQIQARITNNWGRVSLAQGRVQIYFRIMRSGAIDGVRIESPSGNASFDQTALLAVMRSAPLPKLPDGFDADSLGVRFWFMYLGN